MADSEREFLTVASVAAKLIIGTVFGLGLGFLVRVIPARLLGPESYGLLVLPLSVASSLAILGKLGLDEGISRFLPRAESDDECRGIVAFGLGMVTISSGILGATLFLLARPLAELLSIHRAVPLFQVFSLVVPAVAIRGSAIAVFRGLKRSGERILLDNILKHGFVLSLVVIALLGGADVVGAATAWAIGIGLTTLVAIGLVVRLPFFRFGGVDIDIHTVLFFSLPLMVAATKGIFLEYGDILVLGYFEGNTTVGVYDSAFTVAKLLLALFGAFGFIFMPIFSELDASGENQRMNRFYKVVTKWVLALSLPLFLTLFLYPSAVLELLFGPSYTTGALPLAILSAGLIVHGAVGVARDSLISIGRVRVLLWINVISVIVNVLANIVLVQHFGAVGAAAATASTFVLFNLAFALVLYRSTGIHPITAELFAPAVVTFVLAIGGRSITGPVSPLMIPLVVSVFFVLHFTSYLRFGLGEEDLFLLDAAAENVGFETGTLRCYLEKFIG